MLLMPSRMSDCALSVLCWQKIHVSQVTLHAQKTEGERDEKDSRFWHWITVSAFCALVSARFTRFQLIAFRFQLPTLVACLSERKERSVSKFPVHIQVR